jgi:UTP pyrophosphatase
MSTTKLTYLSHYSEDLQKQVRDLIDQKKLSELILKKYPDSHNIKTDKGLYDFTVDLKSKNMRKAAPLSRVLYDNKLTIKKQALGLHSFVSRVQGKKLKAKNEIRIAAVLKSGPLEFLRVIVVHELAHLKEKEHNKSFYKLCIHMEHNYHQLEFDLRLYLTHIDLFGTLYS